MKIRHLYYIATVFLVNFGLTYISEDASLLSDQWLAALFSGCFGLSLALCHDYLLERFFTRKQRVVYVLGVACLLVLFAAILYGSQRVVALEEVALSGTLFATVVVLLLNSGIRFLYRIYDYQLAMEEAKNRQLETELKWLEAQVNPHFLFNTLNNLYGLNLVDPDACSEMILTLADLMRFQIESTKKKQIKLADELTFLRNYVALERIRLTPNSQAELVVQGEVTDQLISPFLMIPFVENAFKHGIGAGETSFVSIHIQVTDEELIFDCRNSLPTQKKAVKSTHTGLNNVRRRLEISYRDQYNLSMSRADGQYTVLLTLQL
jgi:two-component system, LytTR family, sensor kinase